MGPNDKKSKNTSNYDNFPSDEDLRIIRREMLYPDGDYSDIVAPPNASEVDLFKITLCQRIDIYRIERQLKKKEVAKILEIDEARMSEMMNGKIEGYTIERLFGYLKKLDSGYSLSFNYKEQD